MKSVIVSNSDGDVLSGQVTNVCLFSMLHSATISYW